jgi:hypothetical protein
VASRCCILSRLNHHVYQSCIDFFSRIYPPVLAFIGSHLTSAITPPSPHLHPTFTPPSSHLHPILKNMNPTSLDVLLFPVHLALSSTSRTIPSHRYHHIISSNASPCRQCIDYLSRLARFPSNNVKYRKFSCLLCRSLFLYSLRIDIAVFYYCATGSCR